ncbi:MAG TPA: ACP S-malonyltransferase [Syntrophomonadaceae bacterium]|nr:ACP S-malonyltransferase [Syntrophomonadaceae bacterium]
MDKRVFLFPGQGSQYVGMGADLARNYPSARNVFDEADRVLGFPLSQLCFEGPSGQLSRTKYTQPAVLTTSIAVLEVLKEKGIACHAVAGHSLGEYSALVAAGVLSFTDALKIVQRRAELMDDAMPPGQGGMVAVLGLDREKVEEVCRVASAKGIVQPANYNAPGQVVISGTREGLAEAAGLARQAGARRVIPLPVSGPFHSSLMQKVGEALKEYIKNFNFKEPDIPLVMNVTGDYVSDPERIQDYLIEQVSSPVCWEQAMNKLSSDGFIHFTEVGPGQVLSGLVKRIIPNCKVSQVGDQASLEKMLAQDGRTV